MIRDRYVRTWTSWTRPASWVAVVALLALGGCERAVGTGDSDAGVNGNDAGMTDAVVATDAAVQPDAGELIDGVLGWHSLAEEHSGFVRAAEVDHDLLDACSPWIVATASGETWWTYGTSEESLLPLYPHPEHWDRVGLGLITGELSELGQYGHMGSYDRELWITGWELQVCPTVERLGHCVVPRQDDFCQLPDPAHESRRNHLTRIIPGPAGTTDHFELTVFYDEHIMDGQTRFGVTFQLPLVAHPEDPWMDVPVADMTALSITEERLWFGYQLIPYPNAHAGWILRSTADDTLRVSLSAEDDNGQRVHIWGDFPVDEVIAYP